MARCLTCRALLEQQRHSTGKYCDTGCQKEFEYRTYIKRWKQGLETGNRGEELSRHVRRYIFEKYKSQCRKCGWRKRNRHTGKIPLTIEHKDGNWANSTEKNLDLLCPNCHSLTATYCNLNRGNGRPKRLAKIRADSANGRTLLLHGGDTGSIPVRSTA